MVSTASGVVPLACRDTEQALDAYEETRALFAYTTDVWLRRVVAASLSD